MILYEYIMATIIDSIFFNTTAIGDGFNNKTNETFHEYGLNGVSLAVTILLAVLYGTISVMSVIGNGLVILVIAKNKKMQTVTNIFIANLAVADVAIGLLSIPFQFQAAILQTWVLPYFMCSLAPFVQALSVNISVFTLAVIAIDRYSAVIYPLKPNISKFTAHVVIAITWLVGILSSLPMAVFLQVTQEYDSSTHSVKPFCSPHWPKNVPHFGQIYQLYLVLVQYFFPLLIISYAYFRIGYRIWGTEAPGYAVDSRDEIRNRNKRKVSYYVSVTIDILILQIYLFDYHFHNVMLLFPLNI